MVCVGVGDVIGAIRSGCTCRKACCALGPVVGCFPLSLLLVCDGRFFCCGLVVACVGGGGGGGGVACVATSAYEGEGGDGSGGVVWVETSVVVGRSGSATASVSIPAFFVGMGSGSPARILLLVPTTMPNSPASLDKIPSSDLLPGISVTVSMASRIVSIAAYSRPSRIWIAGDDTSDIRACCCCAMAACCSFMSASVPPSLVR